MPNKISFFVAINDILIGNCSLKASAAVVFFSILIYAAKEMFACALLCLFAARPK